MENSKSKTHLKATQILKTQNLKNSKFYFLQKKLFSKFKKIERMFIIQISLKCNTYLLNLGHVF